MPKEIREIELKAVDKASKVSKKVKKSMDMTDVLKLNILSIDAMLNVSEKFFRLTKAGFTQTIGKSIDAASAIQQYEFRLEKLAGSQEAANRKMEFFINLASQVPATLEDIIDAGVSLEAFGADSEKTLEQVTDLAFVMGVTVPEAASAFGRAFAGGSGAADIFRERGILQIIRDFKGIQDLSKLTLPEFRQAMNDAFVAPSGKIAGAAKDAADTWVGALSMIEDGIFKLRRDVGDQVIKNEEVNRTLRELNEILKSEGLRDGIVSLAKDMVTLATSFAKVTKGGFELVTMFNSVKSAQERSDEINERHAKALGRTASKFDSTRDQIVKFSKELKRLEKLQKDHPDLISPQATENILFLMRIIKRLRNELLELEKETTEAQTRASDLAPGSQDDLPGALVSSRGRVPDDTSAVEGGGESEIERLKREIEEMNEVVNGSEIDQLTEKLFDLRVAADPVATAFSNMGNAIGDAVFQSINALVSGEVTMKQALANIAAAAIRGAVEESRVKAIKSLADGLAALAIGDPRAGLHFAAAAKYGAIAGLGIAAAASLSAGGDSGSGSGGSAQDRFREDRQQVPLVGQVPDETGTSGGNLTIIMNGDVVDWDTVWRKKIVPAADAFARDGGINLVNVERT